MPRGANLFTRAEPREINFLGDIRRANEDCRPTIQHLFYWQQYETCSQKFYPNLKLNLPVILET